MIVPITSIIIVGCTCTIVYLCNKYCRKSRTPTLSSYPRVSFPFPVQALDESDLVYHKRA